MKKLSAVLIQNNFYIDDGLKPGSTVKKAITPTKAGTETAYDYIKKKKRKYVRFQNRQKD